MFYTFNFNERSSVLSNVIYPSIVLNDEDLYVIGLVNFVAYNSIPNVDSSNNKFYYGDKIITLPEGTYEVTDIADYITQELTGEKDRTERIALNESSPSSEYIVQIRANKNTLKCEIKANLPIDFTKPNNVGSLLGFKNRILKSEKKYESDFPVDIFKVNTINVECNLVCNSYSNGELKHVLHTFCPTVLPGRKIVENPLNVIYLPINTRYISEIILKITDQDGNLVNFKQEMISVSLHLKRVSTR